ncbi:hypothetical protein PRUPE_1G058800 [Prunus persica]|uniref:Uncharacterized protein n=1 Tax=Prunus persica TaxID=3760 RepID=A0A251QT91_PRUPE|nr:hypothetical protein PRUPE_1G058800 [Prunus persica]
MLAIKAVAFLSTHDLRRRPPPRSHYRDLRCCSPQWGIHGPAPAFFPLLSNFGPRFLTYGRLLSLRTIINLAWYNIPFCHKKCAVIIWEKKHLIEELYFSHVI